MVDWREVRHNPCVMAPTSAVMLLVVGIFWALTFLWQFPIFMLGFLVSPIVQRQQFLIEFLYPTSLGRWAHLWLVRLVQKSRLGGTARRSNDKNRGFHSRALETRLEVIPGRVFCHPLPQLLDNLGYLVVCLPPDERSVDLSSVAEPVGTGKITVTHRRTGEIVAFVVDVGSSEEVSEQISLIAKAHYGGKKIVVQSIFSTHKHHDHTAGNISLREKISTIKLIVGGAVERVPGCNLAVTNGELLPLPKDGANRMEDYCQLEAIATPGHTRGSTCFALRPLRASSGLAFLFTGDTMFCAGAGVPFEADVDDRQDEKDQKRDFSHLVKATASTHAVERCLVELMVRSVPFTPGAHGEKVSDRIFVMPGHEYSNELLGRQFATETAKWKHVTPSTYFETVSQFYVALHRRTLPHSSGKLLCAVGSPLSREIVINPYFRTLRSRGEIALQALEFWHQHFCRKKIPDWIAPPTDRMNGNSKISLPRKTAATSTQWTLDKADLTRSVFTTLYSSDMEALIQDLTQGKVSQSTAAQRLRAMQGNLEQPILSRRPVPGTMPSDRHVYRGLLALVLLGSAPSGLTKTDSEVMNLPDPVSHSNDILVSKKRLVSILRWLDLLGSDNEGRRHVAMITQLWKEGLEDSGKSSPSPQVNGYDATDVEASQVPDKVFLGDLKWSIYGVPREPPSQLRFCMPCSKPLRMDPSHPVHKLGLKPSSGELVRHDVIRCLLCQNMTGCPHIIQEEDIGADRPVVATYGSTVTGDEDDPTVGPDEPFVEVKNFVAEF
jgi:glyoxylase-like metal-dependent hydrolase (beta-lactamase superfamily II)